MKYDRQSGPFWRRVPPWWVSLILAAGAAARLGSDDTNLPSGLAVVLYWLNAVLLVVLLVVVVVDVRRLRRHRRMREVNN